MTDRDQGVQGSLEQLDRTVADLRVSDYRSFERHIGKLDWLLHAPGLAELTEPLVAKVDVDAWVAEGRARMSGMMGSGRLKWPVDQQEEFGLVIALVGKFVESENFALSFADDFYSTSTKFTDQLHALANELLTPFARDFRIYVEAKLSPVRSPAPVFNPQNRRVFVVHGHDVAARETVARYLTQLDLTPVILHEQANRGLTVAEKIALYGDVGFAVVLLTPDDVGRAVDEPDLQRRARQNVMLELGYFVGRLGRERVCALKKGDLEIPSDYVGVVYTPLDDLGAWKPALGRELTAAGFIIDWNRIMGQ